MNPLATIKTEALTHTLYEKGKDKAEKEKAWTIADQSRKVVLTTLAHIIQKADNCSYAQAEREARTSTEYADHINAMGEAREAVILARVKYEAVKYEIQERHARRFADRAQFGAGKVDI